MRGPRRSSGGLAAAAAAVALWLLLAAWPADPPEPRDVWAGLGAVRGVVVDGARAELEADARAVGELVVGEDPEATVAVAWVVVNRSRSRGQTVLGVLTAGRQWGTRLRSGRFRPSWPLPPAWGRRHASAVSAAAEVILGVLEGRVPDPTRGATCFHRAGTRTPPWAPTPDRWRRFGAHWFYSPR